MSYRLRRKSRPQAETNIFGGPLKQKKFSGGMNLDSPASEIKDDELALAENVICREYGLETRPGSIRHSQSLFSMNPALVYAYRHIPATYTGTYANYRHFFAYNGGVRTYPDSPNGTYADVANATSNGGGTGTLSVGTGDTAILPYRRGALVFTSSKISYVEPTIGYQVNTPNPVHGMDDHVSAAANFVYRYLFTFSRIVNYSQDVSTGYTVATDRMASGAEVVHESGSNDSRSSVSGVSTARGRDYGVFNKTTAISSSSGNTIPSADLTAAFGSTGNPGVDSADGHWTHLTVYRTLDVGPTGLNQGDGTGSGNNSELYIWLADIPRSSIGSNYSDTTDDDTLRKRIATKNSIIKTRGFQPIPSGDCAEVTSEFVFVANRANSTPETRLYYCGLSSPELVGYYFPDIQFQRFDDGVRAMRANQDLLTIFCNNSTHVCALTSITTDTSKLQYIPALNYFHPVDRTIGVRDWESLDSVDENTMIGVCSDSTVRVWDGAKWGPDISYGKVNSEIRQAVPASPYTYARGSVGRYYNGAYYLWYSKNSSDTYLTQCLRYGFGKASGSGWTFNTGWVKPYFKTGVTTLLDNTGVKRLIVQAAATSGGYTSGHLYWVETFRPYTGALEQSTQMDRVEVDGYIYGNSSSGSEIAPKWRFRELTSIEESEWIVHEETHNYFRPYSESTGYRSGTSVTMVAYKNGSTSALETLASVPMLGDVHFQKEVSGRRIQLEIQVNRGGFRYVGVDNHCRTLERINYATAGDNVSSDSTTNFAHYQAEIAQNMTFWLTRRDFLLDRVSGSTLTPNGSIAWTAGPDGGAETSYSFPGFAYVDKSASYVYSGDFTVSLFVVPSEMNSKFILVNSSLYSNLYIRFATNLLLDFSGLNSFAISNVAGVSYHHIVVTRSGTTLSAYQNGVLVGTATQASTFGGGSIRIGDPIAGNGKMFDVRIYSAALSASAIAYLYDRVVNNSGDGVLPMV